MSFVILCVNVHHPFNELMSAYFLNVYGCGTLCVLVLLSNESLCESVSMHVRDFAHTHE